LIAPLIRRKLLVREISSRDSRAAMLRMTEEGIAVHKHASQSLKSVTRTAGRKSPPGSERPVWRAWRRFVYFIASRGKGSGAEESMLLPPG